MKKFTTAKFVLPLFGVLVALVLAEPRSAKWGYDFRDGAPWKYETLIARYDFPVLKTQEQIDAERGAEASVKVPYYRYSADVVNSNLRKADALVCEAYPELRNIVSRTLRDIYDRGVTSDDASVGMLSDENGRQSQTIYIQKDKRASEFPADEVYPLSAARAALLAAVKAELSDVNADSLLSAGRVYDFLEPNLSYDAQTTDLVHSQSEVYVSPTIGYVNAGQLIVSEGEIVTPEIYQMLDSYKYEYEHNIGHATSWFSRWGGNIAVSICLVVLFFFCLLSTCRSVIRENYNKYLYLLFVYTASVVIYLLADKFNEYYIFLLPMALVGLYMQSFFRLKSVFAVYLMTLVPMLLFVQSGIMFFVMSLAGGITALYAFRKHGKGARQFLSALFIFIAEAVVYGAFILFGTANFNHIRVLIMLFAGSMLTVAFYPLIYLFERVFGLVSNARLAELADTSSPVLRMLEQKAPGTFQHSLQVSNLACAAARAIGADEQLVRAGALYHDIGKTANPQCFVENESLATRADTAKYHKELTSLQSAQDILRHVTDGEQIAREKKLPQCIIDFIVTHHGTSVTLFFYNKYVREGGDPEMRDQFQYKGHKPRTKEQVLVMLSDSIEAASRTLGDYGRDKLAALVNGIIEGKRSEGQFDESSMTFAELKTVNTVFIDYLSQIYHERIVYPKRNNKQ